MAATKGNKFKCWYCGQDERCTKDHFYPKSHGGTLTVYACSVCQGSKGDMPPIVWLKYIKNHRAISDEAKKRIETAVISLIEKN
jgi:5-methylcytosine-specific restriction endonuclease McrA